MEPIGLLVVHGIGRQERGQSVRDLIEGLQSAYGDALRVTWSASDSAVIEGLGPPVHAIEVYWADVFEDADVVGTFTTDRIFELVWFPSLNWKSGLLTPDVVRRMRVRFWTAALAVLSPFVSSAIFGTNLLAALVSGANAAQTRRDFRRRAARGDRERTKLDDLLDQVAGDVFNYVDGLSRSFVRDTPQSLRLCQSVGEIQRRFDDAARQAVDGGCREIQIVAHSLGSVIAFVSLSSSGRRSPERRAAAQVTRIYTIGSPLQKIRFFWPRLLEEPERGPAMSWHNFYNRLDLVSGKLGAFRGWPSPANHTLPALGGVLTSHVAYHANPSFLAFLGEGLGGPPPTTRSPRWRRLRHAVLATLQTLVAPVLFAVLALIGIAVLLGLAWGTGWVIAKPFELLGLEGVASGIRLYMVLSIAFVIFIGSAITGRNQAKEVHARFWEGRPA